MLIEFLVSLITRERVPYLHQLYGDRDNAIELVNSMVKDTKGKPQIMISDMENPIELTKGREQISSMVNEITSKHIDGTCSVIVFANNETDTIIEITPLKVH